MQRLKKETTKFKKELGKIFPTSKEELARNLSSVLIGIVTIYLFILVFGLLFVFFLESGYKEAFTTLSYTFYVYGGIILSFGGGV